MNAFTPITIPTPAVTPMHSGGYCAQEAGRAFDVALRGYGETRKAAVAELDRVIRLCRA